MNLITAPPSADIYHHRHLLCKQCPVCSQHRQSIIVQSLSLHVWISSVRCCLFRNVTALLITLHNVKKQPDTQKGPTGRPIHAQYACISLLRTTVIASVQHSLNEVVFGNICIFCNDRLSLQFVQAIMAVRDVNKDLRLKEKDL